MRKITLFAIIPLLFGACSAGAADLKVSKSKKAPEWVEGISSQYPVSEYIVGVASADDMNTAKDRARGEISKVFSSKINVESNLHESEKTQTTAGVSKTESATKMATDLRALSQKTLEGIEISGIWQDQNSFRWYALATLERSKIRSIYKAKLTELDMQIEEYKKQMKGSTENVARAIAALKLKSILKVHSGLATDLRVIGGGASASLDDEMNGALKNDIDAALGAVIISVAVSPENSRILTEISKTVNKLGMNVSPLSEKTDIKVSCEAAMSPFIDPTPGSRWKWYTGTASVKMEDVKNNKTFISFNVNSKEAAVSENEALVSAEQSLGRKIGTAINSSLENYFENN